MKPFFSYYGSKWLGAKHYGPPRRNLVIEPFAGSAGYSVYWDCENVRLYDASEDICHAWDWLINCSEDDIRNIPAPIRSNEEYQALPNGPRQVVFWKVKYADTRIRNELVKWYLTYTTTGERTGALKGNNTWVFWDENHREKIIKQKPLIKNWTVENLHYKDIPLEEAHWHVDPPYQGKPGRAYVHSDIDYAHLAEWCRSLPGSVDVCENEGADWLPFESLYSMPTSNRRKFSHEVLWRNDPEPDLFQ